MGVKAWDYLFCRRPTRPQCALTGVLIGNNKTLGLGYYGVHFFVGVFILN